MPKTATALGKSRLESVCTSRHEYIINFHIMEVADFSSGLIPIADVLQVPLDTIFLSYLVTAHIYPAW